MGSERPPGDIRHGDFPESPLYRILSKRGDVSGGLARPARSRFLQVGLAKANESPSDVVSGNSNYARASILLSQQQPSHPRASRDDDHKQNNRARQAAEALFIPKPPVRPSPLVDHASADQSARKPRVLAALPAAAVHRKKPATPVSSATRRRAVPRKQFGRVRALVKYGMTVSQVAEVYGTAAGEIERILRARLTIRRRQGCARRASAYASATARRAPMVSAASW